MSTELHRGRNQFTRQEAMRRARFEYGIYPYEPMRPVNIVGTWVEYRCECGYSTTHSGEIYDHCYGGTAGPEPRRSP